MATLPVSATSARTAFLLLLAAFATLVTSLVATDQLGHVAALGVPTMEPRFADARTITGAGQALAQGLDPLAQNPGDPWGRVVNYPRIWLLPAMLGVGPGHTTAFAALLLLAFGAGLVSMTRIASSLPVVGLLGLALCSPVTWLAVERANNDLLVFGLLAVGAALADHRPRTAAGIFAVGAVLKLYPIFSLTALGGSPGARRAAWFAGAVFAIYLVVIRHDLPLIHAGALQWNRISYGIELLPRAVAAATGWPFAALLAAAAMVLLGVLAASWRWRSRHRLGATTTPHTLAAFRIGAAVLVGTFCLGSNFDYRLLFLLLVLPQLATWFRATRGLAHAAVATLIGASLLVLWSMTWRRALAAALGGEGIGLVLDECLVWTLACGLLAALVLVLPDSCVPAARRGRPFLDASPTGSPGGSGWPPR